MKNIFKTNKKTIEERRRLSKCSNKFEGVASFQVGVGESLNHRWVHSLVVEFSSEDACCLVRLVFEPERLPSEAQDEPGEE